MVLLSIYNFATTIDFNKRKGVNNRQYSLTRIPFKRVVLSPYITCANYKNKLINK